MAYGTFLGLNTALRGLLAQQTALDVTSHNISNVNTEGYSRQRADLRAASALSMPGFNSVNTAQVGTGVEVAGFERMRDQFIDKTLRQELSRFGDSGTTLSSLQQVEAAFGEPGTSGISASLQRFFDSLQKVAANPAEMSARQEFVRNAEALTKDLNQLTADLASIQQQSDDRLNAQVTEINNISSRLAELNRTIGDAVAMGQQPNDLRDERDRLLDKLATKVDFTYTTNAFDQVTIAFDTNVPINLVDPSIVGPPSGYTQITRADLDTAYTAPPQQLTSGEVFADQQMLNVTIPAYQTQLDELANSLAGRFNAMNGAGFDLNGAAGGALFLGIGAGGISFNAAVLADPRLVAASATAGAPGNGDNASAMLDERGVVQGAPLGDTWERFYRATVTDLGTRTEQATRNLSNQKTLTETLQGRRAETAGVAMDEEMSNMLRFQHAYNASARVLSAMDEMLDMLINRTGRVGL